MNNPMQAFVGVDFDVEFMNGYHCVELISMIDGAMAYSLYRPRLNKAQVLEDYTPILVEGFVWDLTWYCVYDLDINVNTNISSRMISSLMEGDSKLLSIAFKGVEKGSDLEDWANPNNVPVLEVAS